MNRPIRRRTPRKENIAAIIVDMQAKEVMYFTKDILTNQIYQMGPRIAASFDALARGTVVECSEIISSAQAILFQHSSKVEDQGSEATCGRLLHNAVHSYVAAIEVARKGYPRELGVLMRLIVESIATALAIAIDGGHALKKFHEGKLATTKCIGIAKKAVPFIGNLNGLLSNNFVHISAQQDPVDGAMLYTKGDQRLDFVITMMKLMAMLLDIVTEVIFATDIERHRYWKRQGEGWIFEPNKETSEWMEKFAPEAKAEASGERATVPAFAAS